MFNVSLVCWYLGYLWHPLNPTDWKMQKLMAVTSKGLWFIYSSVTRRMEGNTEGHLPMPALQERPESEGRVPERKEKTQLGASAAGKGQASLSFRKGPSSPKQNHKPMVPSMETIPVFNTSELSITHQWVGDLAIRLPSCDHSCTAQWGTSPLPQDAHGALSATDVPWSGTPTVNSGVPQYVLRWGGQALHSALFLLRPACATEAWLSMSKSPRDSCVTQCLSCSERLSS